METEDKNMTESRDGYMREYGRRKRKTEMLQLCYNLKKKELKS